MHRLFIPCCLDSHCWGLCFGKTLRVHRLQRWMYCYCSRISNHGFLLFLPFALEVLSQMIQLFIFLNQMPAGMEERLHWNSSKESLTWVNFIHLFLTSNGWLSKLRWLSFSSWSWVRLLNWILSCCCCSLWCGFLALFARAGTLRVVFEGKIWLKLRLSHCRNPHRSQLGHIQFTKLTLSASFRLLDVPIKFRLIL